MKKALWMILAVCLLAVYANAATVTFTADDSVAYPGKYQITASVSGSYGLASFKIYAPQGTFANAVFKAPQTVFVYDTGAGILFTKDCGFSLLRSFNDNTTINAAIAEASQNTVGFDPDELPVPDYAEYYIPVLAYGIGQVQVDLEALCPPSYFVQGGYNNHLAAAEVVLIDNLDSVPALKIGATLESLEDMVSGQEYAPQCGTLANVFVNNTDNTTEAANVVFVNTKLPVGIPGDFNDDGLVDDYDIDLLYDVVWGRSASEPKFDLNGDTVVDQSDVEYFLYVLKNSEYGDADLGGTCDEDDYNNWFFGYENGIQPDMSRWFVGDFDGSGVVDEDDYNYWFFGYEN